MANSSKLRKSPPMPSSTNKTTEYGAIQRDMGTLFQMIEGIKETVERVEINQGNSLSEMKVIYATKIELDMVMRIASSTKTCVDEEMPKIKKELERANSVFGFGSKVGKFFAVGFQIILTCVITLGTTYLWTRIVT